MVSREQVEQVQGEDLRQVMRRVPSPVVVVTAAEEGERRGITIGSMTSVSLDPPLISFNVHQDAETHDLLLRAGRFAVNILTEEQADLAHHFSIADLLQREQFSGVSFHLDEEGLPLLDEVLAIFTCAVETVHEAGDHTLIIASVDAISRENLTARPLLYFEQTYRTVDEEVKSIAFSPVKRGSSESS